MNKTERFDRNITNCSKDIGKFSYLNFSRLFCKNPMESLSKCIENPN